MRKFILLTTFISLVNLSFGQSEPSNDKKKGAYFHLMPVIRIDRQEREVNSYYYDSDLDKTYETNSNHKGTAGAGPGLDLGFGYVFGKYISAGVFANASANIPSSYRSSDFTLGGEIEISPIKWLSLYGRIGYYTHSNQKYFNGLIGGGGLGFNLPLKSEKLLFSVRAGLNYVYAKDHGPSSNYVTYDYYHASTKLYTINIGFRMAFRLNKVAKN